MKKECEYMANAIYDMCLDMDCGDYCESREREIHRMTYELMDLYFNDSTVFKALDLIFS